MNFAKVNLESPYKVLQMPRKVHPKTSRSIMEIDWTLSLSLNLYLFSDQKQNTPE